MFPLYLDILTSPYLCEVLLLADLERYYESSVPDSIVGPSGSPVLQKSLMLKLLLLLMDYLGPRSVGRASGFHSLHHIDDQSPRPLP